MVDKSLDSRKSTEEIAFDIIREIEMSYPVDKLTINSVHLWPLIRSTLLKHIRSTPEEDTRKLPIISFRGYAARIWRKLLGSERRSFKKLKSELRPLLDADLLFYSKIPAFQVRENGKDFDRIIDPVYELFCDNFNTKKFHFSDLASQSSQKQVHAGTPLDPSVLSSFTHGFVNNFHFHKIVEQLQYLEKYVHGKTGCPVELVRSVTYKVSAICAFRKVFHEILVQTKAQVVFVSSYSGASERGLILACRELNITTVDIQHGKQGAFNAHYGEWLKVPQGGFNTTPNFFWVWGEESAKNIKFGAAKRADLPQAVVGGYPYIKRWLDTSAIEYSMDNPTFWSWIENAELSILITLQPFEIEDSLGQLLCETIKTSNPNWVWLIRCHPNAKKCTPKEVSNYLTNCGVSKERFETEYSSTTSLMALLKHADRHVTKWSSCGYEALTFGLKTTYIHPFAKRLFQEYLSKGYFSYADNPDSILQTLSESNAGQSEIVDKYIETDSAVAIKALDVILSTRADFQGNPELH